MSDKILRRPTPVAMATKFATKTAILGLCKRYFQGLCEWVVQTTCMKYGGSLRNMGENNARVIIRLVTI